MKPHPAEAFTGNTQE